MKKLLFIIFFLLSQSAFADLVSLSPSNDGQLQQNNATTNYNALSSYSFNSAGNNSAYMMSFDISSLSGKTIKSAYLYIKVNSNGGGTNDNWTLYRILKTIDLTTETYNIYSTGNNWGTAGALSSGVDYSPTHATAMTKGNGGTSNALITTLLQDAVNAGNTFNLAWRPTIGVGTADSSIQGLASTTPPYLVVNYAASNTTATTFYVRDGGGPFGFTSTTCNGQTNATFTGANGPNCAFAHPSYILGVANGDFGTGALNQQYFASSDILDIDGDSDLNFWFTVSGVTTLPKVGDTYTDGSINTWTVVQSLPTGQTSGTLLLSGTTNPSGTGTLTVATGSGTSPINWTAESVGQAQYQVGGTAPLMLTACSKNATCYMQSIPAGVDSTHQTQVIGTGTNKPQFWGSTYQGGAFLIFNGYVDIENIEITQHSPCTTHNLDASGTVDGVSPSCTNQLYMKFGITLGGNYITTKNLFIHRLGHANIYFASSMGNWNSSYDTFVGSGGGGALDDTFGNNEAFTSTNTMDHDIWAFGGCSEHYPDQNSNVLDTTNYHHCADQEAGDYSLGGGFMQQSNLAPCGSWTVTNSKFLYNIKTNWDFKHCSSIGTMNFYRDLFEGSNGEALKISAGGSSSNPTINIEESRLIANYPVWLQPTLSSIVTPYDANGNPYSSQSMDACRGGGPALIVSPITNGETVNLINSDFESNCVAIINVGTDATEGNPGNQCSGASINAYNSKFVGGYFAANGQFSDLFYNNGTDGNGSGSCGYGSGQASPGGVPFNMYYNSCYNAATFYGFGCSSGSHTQSGDPKFISEIGTTLSTFLGPTSYYDYNVSSLLSDKFYLSSSSPLIGNGTTTGVTYTNGSTNDYNNFANEQMSPAIDIGGLYYGSGGCAVDTTACSTGATCCSGYCISSQCAECIANGMAGTVAQCCSGIASGGTCVASICGDGLITGAEVCDTSGPQLNGQSCASQGFYAGNLGCTAGCASFDTSGCLLHPPINMSMSGNMVGQ